MSNWSQYKKYRAALLLEDPHCYRCGVEHGKGRDALQYHHVKPQRDGDVDHSYGVLLCRSCHQVETNKQRNAHRTVDQAGYSNPTAKPYRHKKKRKDMIEELLTVWS